MIRVLIVDDERNIQKAFRADIENNGDRYTLVDSITSAADAEMVCKLRQVDLVIMDINTANNESGLLATADIKKNCPKTKVIIVTSYTDPHAIKEAKERGADSFWFKDLSPIELIEVMDLTMNGENYWPPMQPDVMLGNTRFQDLTSTEQEVLFQLVRCISLRRIAEEMFIEETTVKYHLRNICDKVGCKNKTELMVLAIQNRLVLPNPYKEIE